MPTASSPEKQREYYLKWKTTRATDFCKNKVRNRWEHICVVFRNILIADCGVPERRGANMRKIAN
jgi:hypothetical protein